MGDSITSQAHTAAADGIDFQTKRKPGGQGADAQTHDCEGNKRARLIVAPREARQRRAAERLKAAWAELDTGHYPMLSMPEELTKMLVAG